MALAHSETYGQVGARMLAFLGQQQGQRDSLRAAGQLRAWAAAALDKAGDGAFAGAVTVEALEAGSRALDPGCSPETLLLFESEAASHQVRVLKPMAEVSREEVEFATTRLLEEMAAPPFTISVETPAGTRLEVVTQALATVQSIKEQVEAAAGIPAGQLELAHLGHRLLPEQTAASCGLHEGAQVAHGVGSAYFWQGGGTLPVPMALHATNRARLDAAFKNDGVANLDVPANAHILLQGGAATTRYDSDNEPLFRQESFFQWAFGVSEPDCYGAIDCATGRATLFVPRLPEEYAVWMGEIHAPGFFREKYGVDDCRYADELDGFFEAAEAAASAPAVLYTLHGMNTDSGNYAAPAEFAGLEKYRVDNGRLFPLIVELRVFKTEAELAVLRYVADVSCRAHMEVMRQCAAGLREYQCEALFQQYVYFNGGCRNCAYTCICAGGRNGATLHYGHAGAPNSSLIKDGDMCLFDMGAEYHCYTSDITCSFPANGTFTPDQAAVYSAVLAAVEAVEAAMRPGTMWADMHRLAWRVMMGHMLAMGVLQGDLEALIEAEVPELFMACGLGHFIGLDTHDVGGYPRGVVRLEQEGIAKLRTTRCLEAGMVLTVEPGLYFNAYQFEKGMANPAQAPFLNAARLAELKDFGGVRIEDMVVVTADGIENITTVPRSVAEVEAICRGEITAEPLPGAPQQLPRGGAGL